MIIKVGGSRYKVSAERTMECPAGTAYWLVQARKLSEGHFDTQTQAYHEGEPDTLAAATVQTKAIYGSPTIAHYPTIQPIRS